MDQLAIARRRGTRTLFAGAGAGTVAFYGAATLTPLVAEDLSGSSSLSGVPVAALAIGTGLGALTLSRVMSRHGRRPGLTLGYVTGATGGLVGLLALRTGWFPLLVVAALGLGFAHSGNQLARYASAEMYPAQRRASALAVVVWAATIGALAGPNLLGPADDLLGDQAHRGGFTLAVLMMGVAAVVVFVRLRPDPSTLATDEPEVAGRAPSARSDPRVQVAFISLLFATVVMVLIMATTPVHVRHGGEDIEAVGVVMSAHFFGMFALSPLSGWFATRFGPVPGILTGFGVMVAAALFGASGPSGLALVGPLFLLGLGWSLAFVSGSTLLTQGRSAPERTRLQGTTDTIVWLSTSVASLSSGVVLGAFDYATLCLLGAGLVIVPVTVAMSRRAAVRMAT